MTIRRFLSIIPLLLAIALFLPSLVEASGCGTIPSSVSSSVSSCIPFNSVSSGGATSTGFVGMLSNFPTGNALTGNFVVYNGVSGSFMPAWAENSVTVWVNFGANTFTVANGIYYIGLSSGATGNFMAGATSSTGGNFIGECPTCTSTYAQYDNGYTVFNSFYDNFLGTTLKSQWTNVNNGGSATVSNGVTITPSDYMYSATLYPTNTYTFDSYYQISSLAGSLAQEGLLATSGAISTFTGLCASGSGTYIACTYDGTGSGEGASLGISTATNYLFTTYITSGNVIAETNYGSAISSTTTHVPSGLNELGFATAASGTLTVTYVRARVSPPNGKMPTVTYGAVQTAVTSPTLSQPTASNSVVDVGQNEIISASISGGTAPFTVNTFVVKSASRGTILESNTISGYGGSTPSFLYQVPNNGVAFPYNAVANVMLIDSASNMANSIYSSNFLVYNTLISTAFTNTNTILDPTEFATFTANVNYGAPPYTYNFLVYNAIGLVGNYLTTSSSNTLTYNFQLLGRFGSGADTANVYVNDSATKNMQVFNSIGFTAENVLALSISPSTATIQNGQSITINALATGGYGTYSYAWYNNAGCSSSISGSTNSITVSPTSTTIYCVQVTDQASSPDSNTITSEIIVIYSPLTFLNTMNTIGYPGGNYLTANYFTTYYPFQLSANSFTAGTYNLNYTPELVSMANPTAINEPYASVTYNINTGLTGNVIAYNVIVGAGITLTTNGYYVVCIQLCDWYGGTVSAGLLNNGAPGGSVGNGAGGSTLASGGTTHGGSGGTPAAPTVNNANIVTWITGGLDNYFGGGGGGADGAGASLASSFGGSGGGSGTQSGDGNTPGAGGSGAHGCYIQANVIIAGTTSTVGSNGASAGNFGGGGGGGGSCVFAYGSSYTAGTNLVSGGSGGSGSSTAGGNGGAGTITTYQYATQPIATPPVSFAIQQVESNVLNYAYILPSNSLTGNYFFQTKETQYANSMVFNALVNVNMTDVKTLTYAGICSPSIQYFPNCANATFTATPSSWEIVSDYPGNRHLNQPLGDTWSNANVSFQPEILLNYGSPLTSFQINLTNNPIVVPVTQTSFGFIASNTAPSSPTTREILNLSTWNASQSSQPVNAFIQATVGGIFNNYTISQYNSFNTFIVGSSSWNGIWMPSSNYKNPVFTFINNIFSGMRSSNAGGATSTRYLANVPVTNPYPANLLMFFQNITTSVNYDVGVENLSTATLAPSIVTEILLNPITNAKMVVNQFTTTSGFGSSVNFQQGAYYYFNATYPSGAIQLTNYGPVQIASCTTGCTIILPFGNTNKNYVPSQLANFAGSGCTNSIASSPTNSIITLCTFKSLNGSSFTSTLQIMATNLSVNNKITCSNTLAGSSGQIACQSYHVNNTVYNYVFYVYVGNVKVELATGQFGTITGGYGTDGAFIALLITVSIAIGLGWTTKRGEMFLVGAGIGLAASGLMDFVALPIYGVLGGAMIFIGIGVFVITRPQK